MSHKLLLSCGAAVVALCVAPEAAAQTRAFNVPAQPALNAIPEFARQAQIQIVAPAGDLQGVRTPAVVGDLEVRVALARLLEGTPLRIATDSGQLITLRSVAPARGGQAGAGVGGLAGTSSEAVQLDQVVVTATRSRQELARIPARVEVVTRKEIEDNNFVTTVEALAQTPGINVVQSGGAGAITSVFSRGANSKHTLALFDGIRLNDASAPNGQYNFGQDTVAGLERIEVVRGAASSVYGSDAIGGVVNFIPRLGGDRAFEPFFEASAGNRETWRLSVGAAGTSDIVSYGVTVEHFETAGFNATAERFPDGLGENDGSRFDAFTGVAEARLNPLVKVRGLIRWRETETDLDDAALDRIGRSAKDQYFVWRIGPDFNLFDDRLHVELNAGEVRNEREDTDAADANQAFPAPASYGEGVRSFANWRNALDLGDVAGLSDVHLSGGIEWQRESIDVWGGYSDPLSKAEKALGVYGLARGRAAGRVDLQASVRRDDTDAFGDETTWNLGAVLDLPEIGGRLYASTGSSFKAPTLSERFTTSTYYLANPDLRPEKGRSWEIGADYRPLNGDVTLELGATYFSSEIEDLIEYDFAQLQNINIGLVEINGYEAYVDFAPSPLLRARINYTYTDARNGVNDTRLLRRPPHVWGASLAFTPSDRLSATLTYLSQGERADVLYDVVNPWGLGGGYLGNGQADGYDIVNLSARYDLSDRVSVFGGVTNLFDTEYENPESYRGAPRSVSIGLRGRF